MNHKIRKRALCSADITLLAVVAPNASSLGRLSCYSCDLASARFNYDHLSRLFLIIAQPCEAQNTHYKFVDMQNSFL